MKKLISKLLLLMAVLAMAFSLTACGIDSRAEREKRAERQERRAEKEEDEEDKDEDTTQDEDKDEDKTQNGDETQSKDKKGNALFNSIADYVNSDEIQSALTSLKSSLPEGMSIDIVAEGENKLVYIFTYQSIAHTEGDGMAEALEQAIGAQDAVFQQTANSIKPFVDNDEVIVEIRYVDMNGAVIFAKAYTAE